MGNHAVNPQCKMGPSTALTPIQTFLPTLKDVSWAIGIVAVILDLLGDEPKRKHKTVTQSVRETIDLNDYLPTSIGSYSLRVPTS